MAASHPLPLHITLLKSPSVDSSDTSPLDDYDSSRPQTRFSYGRRRRISIAVIVPGILIFIASAGLASSLLVWLLTRRVRSHIPSEGSYFLHAIVAMEGTSPSEKRDDGSLDSSTTMYGLAMSALSVQLVTLTVPSLLGLLGYRLASMWILGSMPTAAQYGLLVKLCGAANIFGAYETVRYLKRGRKRRSQAPSSLILALTILVLAIVLNRLLSAADIWLHVTTSTFLHIVMTEIPAKSLPAMGTKINVTACPGPAANPLNASYCNNCARVMTASDTALYKYSESTRGWGDLGMVTEGLSVVENSSSTSRSYMINDMAVLVPRTAQDRVDKLTFGSFGLVAHCQPVVDCLVDYTPQSGFYCPSFNPPYNVTTHDLANASYSGGVIELLNLTNNPLLPDPLGGYPLHSVLNPYGARVALYWSPGEAVFPADGSPGWYRLVGGSIYGTLDGNKTYVSADSPVPSNFNTTSALFAALGLPYSADLVDYLMYILTPSLALSTEAFNTVLSRNMSYAAMGLASPLFERDVSTGGNTITPRSASRYPLAPLSAVLAILYTYALLAFVITASSVMLSSQEIIVKKNDGKEHSVAAIELVQLRLTNPLASIAERFVDPARPELLETSAVDMFHEYPHADKLGVIMEDDGEENGESSARS